MKEVDVFKDCNMGDGIWIRDHDCYFVFRIPFQIAMKDGSGAKHYGAFAFIKKNKQLKKR